MTVNTFTTNQCVLSDTKIYITRVCTKKRREKWMILHFTLRVKQEMCADKLTQFTENSKLGHT